MPSSDASVAPLTALTGWTDGEEKVTSDRVSRTNWQKGTRIVDYRDRAVPDRLKAELQIIHNL